MNFDPSSNLIEEESSHLFLCYCSFVNNLKGKKLSVQNVFVHTLQDEKLKNIVKLLLSFDTDQEIVKMFLDFDPTIAKSKYVTKYVNSEAKKKAESKKKK